MTSAARKRVARTPIDVAIPGWLGLGSSIFPNVETVAAQVIAAVLVIGSYFLAQELRVGRPRRRGGAGAVRAVAPPSLSTLQAES